MSAVVARFRNLGGAMVILRRHPGPGSEEWYDWHCKGCADGVSVSPGFKEHRDQANEHAGTCRAERR